MFHYVDKYTGIDGYHIVSKKDESIESIPSVSYKDAHIHPRTWVSQTWFLDNEYVLNFVSEHDVDASFRSNVVLTD